MSASQVAPANVVLTVPDPVHPERPPCRCAPTYRAPASVVAELPDPLRACPECGARADAAGAPTDGT